MRFPALGAIFAPGTSNVSAVPIAICKDVTIDFKITKKGLRGQWKWFIDVAEFGSEATIKIKNAEFKSNIIQMLFNGITNTTGQVLPATGEAQTVPGTPFAVTVTNSAQFAEDGGVLDYTAGKWLTRKADGTAHGSLATGQYSLSTPTSGIYTFADADTTHSLSIVYSYTAANGFTNALNNATMGPSTALAMRIYNQYTINGVVKAFGLKVPAVHFDKATWSLKSEDWAEQDLEGMVAQDPTSQNVFTHYVGD